MKNHLKNILQSTIFPLVYSISSLFKVRKYSIILIDAHNDNCPESMEILRNRLIEKQIPFRERYHNFSKIGTVRSFFVSIRSVMIVARTDVVILCDNYLALDSFNSRKETTIIQLWHGSGSYKKFGYDSNDTNLLSNESNKLYRYDYVTTSSKFASENFSTAMRLSADKFLDIGLSRTDRFLDDEWIQETRKKIFSEFPELKTKKIVLWTPTFRTLEQTDQHIGETDIDLLSESLGESYVVIKKLHPHISKENQYSKFTSSEFMTVADILISDYSSIVLDWLMFDKKTIMFIPDYNEYKKKNGFYVDPNDFPTKVAYNLNELLGAVESDKLEDSYEVDLFKNKMIGKCDGNSTERVIDLILSKLGG